MSTNDLGQAVARLVRAELAARQVDVADFAKTIDQPKTTVWRKVSGKSKMTVDDVDLFARGLGWTLPELLTRVANRQLDEATPPTLSEHLINQVSPEKQPEVRKAKQEATERRRRAQPNG